MRMDPESGETALELIDRLSDDELADVIFQYGDERRSRRIARSIKKALASGELKTTLDLRRATVRAVGPARVGGVDPATRTFQALRIAVNRELQELEALLASLGDVVAEGGVAAIISFHSLEDRLVKRAFQSAGWQRLTKKPVMASDDEQQQNARSRSAKLRAARRIAEPRPVPSDAPSSRGRASRGMNEPSAPRLPRHLDHGHCRNVQRVRRPPRASRSHRAARLRSRARAAGPGAPA